MQHVTLVGILVLNKCTRCLLVNYLSPPLASKDNGNEIAVVLVFPHANIKTGNKNEQKGIKSYSQSH